jgi:hypothetical protein
MYLRDSDRGMKVEAGSVRVAAVVSGSTAYYELRMDMAVLVVSIYKD